MENSNFRFARICSVTGFGMNEGWVVNQGALYIRNEEDAIEFAKSQGHASTKELYDECQEENNNPDGFYWTEWDADEEQDEWYESPYEDGREAVLVSAQ
jgi:hypothetical protein